jgi:hypothetical protein
MANVEVAYQLRTDARFLVASQELVPGSSWPYQKVLGELRAHPALDASALAQGMVREFVQHYTDHPPGAGDITKVALDLSKTDELARRLDLFASALLEKIDANAPGLAKAQIDVRSAETRNGLRRSSKFDFHLFDMATLARRVARASDAKVQAAANALLDTLMPGAGAVLAEGHVGDWFEGIGGVTVYLPQPPLAGSSHYGDLDFAKETCWPRLLREYRDCFPP